MHCQSTLSRIYLIEIRNVNVSPKLKDTVYKLKEGKQKICNISVPVKFMKKYNILIDL